MKTRKISKVWWVYSLVVGIFIAGIIVVFVVMFISPEVEELSYLSRLGREGTVSQAVILNKGVKDALTSPTDGCLSSALWIRVQFDGPNKTPMQRVLGVTSRSYHSYSPGDTIRVAYLIDTPGRYQIWYSAEDNEAHISQARKELAVSLVVIPLLGFALLAVAVTLYFSNPWRASEEVSFEVVPKKCPVCGSPVEAGSVRTPRWDPEGRRRRFFQRSLALPGDKWYAGLTYRELPAYHCPNCKTILFKYK
jgi:hypothetical protein